MSSATLSFGSVGVRVGVRVGLTLALTKGRRRGRRERPWWGLEHGGVMLDTRCTMRTHHAMHHLIFA